MLQPFRYFMKPILKLDWNIATFDMHLQFLRYDEYSGRRW